MDKIEMLKIKMKLNDLLNELRKYPNVPVGNKWLEKLESVEESIRKNKPDYDDQIMKAMVLCQNIRRRGAYIMRDDQ